MSRRNLVLIVAAVAILMLIGLLRIDMDPQYPSPGDDVSRSSFAASNTGDSDAQSRSGLANIGPAPLPEQHRLHSVAIPVARSPSAIPEAVYVEHNAPDEFRANPTTLPAPVARMVEDAEERERQELEPDEQGRPGRVRLLRAEDFKYPHLRVEERFAPLGNGRFNPVPEVLVSVASHVMIHVDRDHSNADLEAVLAEVDGRLLQRYSHSRVALVQVPEVRINAVPEMIAALTGKRLIQSAEADYVVGTMTDPEAIVPNDADWPLLWGMKKIQADKAWNISRGSRNVVVAVLDTGIDYTHPDLISNTYYNPNESANGQDTDENGFRDDLRGWNFVSNNNNPMDDQGHGSHCAGTIGAMGNNEIGVVGVAWNVQLMPLKFLSHQGAGTFSDAIAAIEYSTMMGVDLTSNSWGGGAFSDAMYAAIEEARDADILFVAAAGNRGGTMPGYPARYGHADPGEGKPALANVISVGASDIDDNLGTFSNRQAHIAAPGVNIRSTVHLDRYDSYDGTSMAAPHVAGAAALIRSVRPELSYTDIRNWLINSADQVPAMTSEVEDGRRLNLYKALNDNLTGAFVVYRDSTFADQNSNGILEPGETVDMTVTLSAVGTDPATNVSATLSTASTNITVTQPTASYGNIALWAEATNTGTPYAFAINPATPTPYTFTFTLTIAADGVADRTETFEHTIYRAVTVSGTVRTLLGEPFDNAQVSYSGPTTGTVNTAIEGTYTFLVVNGSYTLQATAPGYQRATRPLTVAHDSDPADFQNIDFILGNAVLEVAPPALTATTQPGGKVEVEMELRNDGNLQLLWNLQELTYGYEYLPDGLTQGERPDLHWRAPVGGGVTHFPWNSPVWDPWDWTQAGMEHQREGSREGSVDPFQIGFDFPFYDESFNIIRLNRRGWISFTQSCRSTNPDTLPTVLPSHERHGNMIAFAWAVFYRGQSYGDQNPGNSPPMGGRYRSTPHDTVFQSKYDAYDHDPHNLSHTGPLDKLESYIHHVDPYTWAFTFNEWGISFGTSTRWDEYITGQVELRSDGTIILRYESYEPIQGRSFVDPDGPIYFGAGIQNGSRTKGLMPIFRNHGHLPTDNSVIVMRPTVGAHWLKAERDAGSIIPLGGTQTIRFTFDAKQLPPGEYTTTVVVESNDTAGNGVLEIPVTFTVSEASSKLAMSTPLDNAEAEPGDDVTLTATLEVAGSIAAVTFLRGEEILAENVPASGNTATFAWQNIPGGRHALSARAVRAGDQAVLRAQPHHLNAGQGIAVELTGVEDQLSPTGISRSSALVTRYDGIPVIFSDPDDITEWGTGNTPGSVEEHIAIAVPDASGTNLRISQQGFFKHPVAYEVTAHTVIEGEFRSYLMAELDGNAAVGLGMHNNNTRTNGRIIQLTGSRTNKGTIQAYNTLTANHMGELSPGPWQAFRIPIGAHYTGSMTHMVFLQANWSDWYRVDLDSQFRNIRIYEDDGGGEITYEWSFSDSARSDTTPSVTRTFFTPSDKEITVTARSGIHEATATRIVPMAGEENYNLRVNFRQESAVKLANYLTDTGKAFGERAKDVRFGWDSNRTGNMNWQNTARVGNGAWWEAEVPNGYYDVTVRAIGRGPAEGSDPKQTHIRINSEDIINHLIQPYAEITRTITVPVEDGKLRMSVHANTSRIDWITAQRTENVQHPPVAAFTMSTQQAAVVSFDASASYDVDGNIVSYAWDFGDGTTGSGVTITNHSFPGPGIYQVTLTVTDNDGLTGTTSQYVVISPTGRVITMDIHSLWEGLRWAINPAPVAEEPYEIINEDGVDRQRFAPVDGQEGHTMTLGADG